MGGLYKRSEKNRADVFGRKMSSKQLGDGIVTATAPVAPLLHAQDISSSSSSSNSFLRTPVLRLVSLHPALSATLSFLRVPEIHDGFSYKVFVARNTTVGDVLNQVVIELGLRTSLPMLGASNLEYVLELNVPASKPQRLSRDDLMSQVISAAKESSATLDFCVPDEWYRRKSRNTSSSDSTVRPSPASQESDSDSDDEEEGTAKAAASPNPEKKSGSGDWKGTFSQNRLSSMFESFWGGSNPEPTTPTRSSMMFVGSNADNRKSIVSDPILPPTIADENDDYSESEFEEMLQGMTSTERDAMYRLTDANKRVLLRQRRQPPSPPKANGNGSYATMGPSTSAHILPRLFPQLTGGAVKRASIWGGSSLATAMASPTEEIGEFSIPGDHTRRRNRNQVEKVMAAEPIAPLQPQTTGGTWSFWLSLAGNNSTNSAATSDSPKWYADSIRTCKISDPKIVANIQNLRVHLDTARVSFLEEFLVTESGLEILGRILADIVKKGGKSKSPSEDEIAALLELVKCLRVLLNKGGSLAWDLALSHPTLITHLTYALHGSSPRLRTQTSDLLAGICKLCEQQDLKPAVHSALSDYCSAYGEDFRFEELIASLRLPEKNGWGQEDQEEAGVWEARRASMTLVNALVSFYNSVEDRLLLQDEFSRRGLDNVTDALRFTKPPDDLLDQLEIYAERKIDDEHQLRERLRSVVSPRHKRTKSDSEFAWEELVGLAKQHGDIYPKMVAIMRQYGKILERDVGWQLKADLFAILDEFVAQAALLDNFDDSWQGFMKRFAHSVEPITGQEIEVRAASDEGSLNIVEQELEDLRNAFDSLSEERTKLKDELSHQIAEINTLKSLAPLGPPGAPKSQGKAGSEKEKLVNQLQAELARFKAQNPSDGRDADEKAKRERDRIKWNNLKEEIAKYKAKNDELETTLTLQVKNIAYLNRALESVYNRFTTKEERRAEGARSYDGCRASG
ncbi:armadillo-type protein [Flagelloscypha sp. PMI_526]|nr:armadillo-type protein [Flagelloscypha sp. PMI_526]